MLVLVTGGAGYIGSHTVRELQLTGYDVLVLDNLVYGHRTTVEDILKVPLVISQVGNNEFLRDILSGLHPATKGHLVDAIIHFAAYAYVGESVNQPLKYYRNNVVETITLLEEIYYEKMRRNKLNLNSNIPIIFSSTCATYGIPETIPILEDVPQLPINPYGRSKLMIENVITDSGKAYDMNSVIFRYFNAAGAHPDYDLGENHIPETHLIPIALEVANGDRDFLDIFGEDYETKDGTCIRDYTHVVDIAKAHVLGLKKVLNEPGQHVYNLGTGKGSSVKEVIKTVEYITGTNVKISSSERRAGDPPVLVACSEKAQRELSWLPDSSNLHDIISDAWNWYKTLKMN
tara:strand:+ start:1503 stop:2540 length:1038 start_codon:yes stop_codon:yes gene_type:complete